MFGLKKKKKEEDCTFPSIVYFIISFKCTNVDIFFTFLKKLVLKVAVNAININDICMYVICIITYTNEISKTKYNIDLCIWKPWY